MKLRWRKQYVQRPCGRRSLALRGLEGGAVNEFQWEKAKVTKTTVGWARPFPDGKVPGEP